MHQVRVRLSAGPPMSHSSNITEQRENRTGNGAGLVSQKPGSNTCSVFPGEAGDRVGVADWYRLGLQESDGMTRVFSSKS